MLDVPVRFVLPKAGKPRKRWYRREQVAALVWEAYRRRRAYTFTEARSHGEKVGTTKRTEGRPARHLARYVLFSVYTATRAERVEQASFVKEAGRPWIDLENGVFHRTWEGEDVPDNKRAAPIRIPGRLLAHCRRWHRQGARYLVEYQGRPVNTSSGMYRLVRDVLGEEEAKGLNRHSFRHTCATWLMAAGTVDARRIAEYLSCDEKTVWRHYGHHHPDFQSDVDHAFTSGSAGKVGSKKGRDARAA